MVGNENNGNNENNEELSEQDQKFNNLMAQFAEEGIAEKEGKKSNEGIPMFAATQQRQSAVHYLATAGRGDEVYKKNAMMAALLDQMARTVFKSREERICFTDYLEWVKEFEQDYDYAYWWVVSAISEDGRSRSELVDAVTTINSNQRVYNYGDHKGKPPDNTIPK